MLKKLICFFVAVLMILFMWTANSSMKSYNSSLKKEVFLYKSSSSGQIVQNNKPLYFFKKGESYVIFEKEDIETLCEFYNAQIKFTEKSESGTNYYLFSKDAKYKTTIKGKIISLHIYIDQEKTVLGTPIIYGSL